MQKYEAKVYGPITDKEKDLYGSAVYLARDVDPLLSKPTMDFRTMYLHFQSALDSGKERACGKKVNYKSEESATKAAAELNAKKDRENYHELEAYPCVFCNGWHVGGKFDLSVTDGISEKKSKLWDAFIKWRDEIGISCAEAVWQTDEVLIEAPALIETLCEVAGYTPEEEE